MYGGGGDAVASGNVPSNARVTLAGESREADGLRWCNKTNRLTGARLQSDRCSYKLCHFFSLFSFLLSWRH